MGNEAPIKIADNTMCYVCGRNNENLQSYFVEIIGRVSTKINGIQERITVATTEYRANVESKLKSVENNPYLVIGYPSLVNNHKKFEKLIPNLDYFLSFNNKYGTNSSFGDPTLADIIATVNKLLNSDPAPGADRLRSELDGYISYKKSVEKLENEICNLGEHIIRFGPGNTEVSVPICFFCKHMFKEASDAAFYIHNTY